jgi:hypothetical protein
MQLKKIKMNSDFPITVEDYPSDYKGYEFITLIKYNDEVNLGVIDNVTKRHISAFCLDLCNPMGVPEADIITIANEWFINNKDNYPVSVEFCKRGLEDFSAKISKAYSIDYISRIIGPVFYFEMNNPLKTRKRKRKIPRDNPEFQSSIADFKTIKDYSSS